MIRLYAGCGSDDPPLRTLQDSFFQRLGDGAAAVVDLQLRVDIADVSIDGVVTDEEFVGNLFSA